MGFPSGSAFWPQAAAEAAALGNPPAEGAVIRQVSIDNSGVIVYIKDDGIYTSGRAGGLLREVAVGDEAPRTEGRFAQFLDLSSATVDTGILGLGRDLRIVFKARIDDGREGIFLFSENRGVMALALPGDIAANTGGGAFHGFPDRVLISEQGTILFKATVEADASNATLRDGEIIEGLFFVPRQFVDLGPGGDDESDIGTVAVQGEAAPETGGGVYASFRAYSISEIGLVVPAGPFFLTVDLFGFVANVDDGGVPQVLYVSSLVVAAVAPLVLELQPRALAFVGGNAAGLRGQSTYASFEDVVVTRNEVVFHARLNSLAASRAEGDEPSEGIFQIAAIGPAQIDTLKVLQSRRAPVFGSDVTFAGFGRMVANNAEELVFEAELAGDGPQQGLFSVTLGPLNLVSETLSVGDPAPGTNGGVYGRLGPLSLADDGPLAFQADIEGGDMREAIFSELAKRARLVDGVQ